MRDLSKFEFLNLARPTRFQFINFSFLFSSFFRIWPNGGKRLEKDILFYQFPAKADPSAPPSPFCFPSAQSRDSDRNNNYPFPAHICSISFTNFPFFPSTGKWRNIRARYVFFTPTVCPTCHRPKLPPRDPCCQRASPDFSSPLFLRSLPRGKGGKTRVQPAFRAVPNKCI